MNELVKPFGLLEYIEQSFLLTNFGRKKLMRLLRQLFLFFFFSVLIYPMEAIAYKDLLVPGVSLTYEHWHIQKNKVTGYSHFHYKILEKDGKEFIIETNENTKPDGKVFTQKTLWFDAGTGQAVLYEEKDFRSGSQIKNTYSQKAVITRLTQEGQTKEFRMDIERNMVPFEVITLYLRKNISQLLKKKSIKITLYLPAVAFELEENGLPLSLSKMGMIMKKEKTITLQTPLGKLNGIQVLGTPESWLIRTLLPTSRTHFRFVISEQEPYYILQFQEGDYRHILKEITTP